MQAEIVVTAPSPRLLAAIGQCAGAATVASSAPSEPVAPAVATAIISRSSSCAASQRTIGASVASRSARRRLRQQNAAFIERGEHLLRQRFYAGRERSPTARAGRHPSGAQAPLVQREHRRQWALSWATASAKTSGFTPNWSANWSPSEAVRVRPKAFAADRGADCPRAESSAASTRERRAGRAGCAPATARVVSMRCSRMQK